MGGRIGGVEVAQIGQWEAELGEEAEGKGARTCTPVSEEKPEITHAFIDLDSPMVKRTAGKDPLPRPKATT